MAIQGIPYSLSRFEVKNYRSITDMDSKVLPTDAPWIFFTGENSYGKTTLLQAIALGLAGYSEAHTLLIQKQENPEIKITIKAEGSHLSFSPEDNITLEKDDDPIMPLGLFHLNGNLAAYGASRTDLQSDQSQNKSTESSTATYGLFKPDGLLKNIEYELLISFFDNKPRFEAITQMLIRLIPSLEEIRVENRVVLYIEADEAGKAFGPVPFSQLALGVRSIVAMAGDIFLRLTNFGKNFGGFDEIRGIVLIDELDAHLHPKWQRLIPRLLSEIFPHVQFIASTHSPIPLLGAPKGSVVLKVNRSVEDGITIEQLDIKLDRLTPNIILTSPIFDFSNIIAGEVSSEVPPHTEDTYDDMRFNERLRHDLESLAEQSGTRFDKLFGEK